MKKYTNTIIKLCMLFLLVGCDNYLEEDARGILSPDVFFQSDADAKAAVNGVYVPLYDASMYSSYGLSKFYVYGADVIEPSREGGGQLRDISAYLLTEERDAEARPTWLSLYKMIQDANIVLAKIENNPSLTDAGRNQFLGETLFLRAFAYYHLTNIWGDVPYYRDNLPIDDVRKLPRTDKAKIRTDLTTDLAEAIKLLPSTYGASELGRPTKWAAATLAGKIHLIQKEWKPARDLSVDIIKMSPHQLLPEYKDVFDVNNQFNAENIFQIVFVKDQNPTITTDLFSPRLRDEPKNSADKQALGNALKARNEGFTGYSLAIPKAGFVEDFPVDDLRRPMNVIQNYLGIDLKFPYMPKMWNLDQINSPRENHGENYIVFRLADVYLMAAEAENELNGPGAAYQYINEVRKRAYSPEKPIAGLGQDDFRKAIYDERRWELAGEGHRRMDLIRWGILLEVIKNTKHNAFDPQNNIQPHHVLFPIPSQEILLNPVLLESDPTNNGYR